MKRIIRRVNIFVGYHDRCIGLNVCFKPDNFQSGSGRVSDVTTTDVHYQYEYRPVVPRVDKYEKRARRINNSSKCNLRSAENVRLINTSVYHLHNSTSRRDYSVCENQRSI